MLRPVFEGASGGLVDAADEKKDLAMIFRVE